MGNLDVLNKLLLRKWNCQRGCYRNTASFIHYDLTPVTPPSTWSFETTTHTENNDLKGIIPSQIAQLGNLKELRLGTYR